MSSYDGDPEERARLDDIQHESDYYDTASSNFTKQKPCEQCKGKIGDMDVEGHYSGVCAHCRGDE